jgi:hypothetical protein
MEEGFITNLIAFLPSFDKVVKRKTYITMKLLNPDNNYTTSTLA